MFSYHLFSSLVDLSAVSVEFSVPQSVVSYLNVDPQGETPEDYLI